MMNPARQLFEATTINGLRLGNRLVRSATWEGLASEDGQPTAELIDLYRQLARGGIGLIVTGFAYVSGDGKPFVKTLGLHDDSGAAAWRALTAAVHQEGGKICVQLGHAGGQTRASLCGGRPLAPSAIAAPQYHPEHPQAITSKDIGRLLDAFAAAARRAKAYGFDAVQLHGAHGYLLNQFLAPHTNQRSDLYGGDLTGRSRFALEVLQRVRSAVGADYPVLIKLNGSDHLPDGLQLEEAVQFAQALDRAGIDAIEVSGGTPASGERNPLRRWIASPEQEAYHLPLAQTIKRSVRCPVMVVGGIRSLWTAKGILRRGEADYISLCRPLIQRPDLPQHWRWAEGDTPSRCTSCNGCYKAALKGGLRCVLNEAAAAEGKSA
jgi:2,4-dienoyl-CoA reductase-like NADH-dependent reductase (Old Yellow Enzyme family)